MERLNVFKKQKIKAVILLEAVISLAIFASIATLLLGQIQESRKREVELLKTGRSFASGSYGVADWTKAVDCQWPYGSCCLE